MVRKITRNRASTIVTIIHEGGKSTAHLRDYSGEGICLDNVRDVMAGDVLSLHCKGAMIAVEVRWVRAHRAGMCFAPECSAAEKARFLAAASGGRNPAHAARIFGFSELT